MARDVGPQGEANPPVVPLGAELLAPGAEAIDRGFGQVEMTVEGQGRHLARRLLLDYAPAFAAPLQRLKDEGVAGGGEGAAEGGDGGADGGVRALVSIGRVAENVDSARKGKLEWHGD